MTELVGKKWNKQYEKLVEFKRKHGNCVVPSRYEEDVALGVWVALQRKLHRNNELLLDRKGLLDDIGFLWRVRALRAAAGNYNSNFDDKKWNTQYEKVVEFKRKHGNCLVPSRYHEDMSLGKWVGTQRVRHAKNKMQPDRKKLLDEIGFVWKAGTVAARSSTTNVRGLITASFHALYSGYFSHFLSCSAFNLCVRGIRIRKRRPAVWVFQTKQH
jgi:hypothetical protein